MNNKIEKWDSILWKIIIASPIIGILSIILISIFVKNNDTLYHNGNICMLSICAFIIYTIVLGFILSINLIDFKYDTDENKLK